MSKKNSILIPGIAAILILVAVQVYVIKDLWVDKDILFDLKYKILLQEAMDQLNRLSRTDGFENALVVLNNYAKETLTDELGRIKSEEELRKLKEEALQGAYKILNELENLSPYLKGYFKRQGSEGDFSRNIEINYLQFLDFDNKLEIYANPAIFRSPNAQNDTLKGKPKSKILVNRFFREDNYYRISFDFYIDFSGKQKMVFRDMAIYLAMSIFSILVVVTILIVTFRNLMEEKRLSNLKTDFINNMTHEIKTPL
ncbi:MAG TPA: hypothetical protein P5348_10625, partial [Bacteroidales bacterium]|nr:hypothetical protein [Bacteroidales bacterium]